MALMNHEDQILSIRDLSVVIDRDTGSKVAINSLSFDIPRGATLALVGESGSGKSLTALSTMGILPSPPARVVALSSSSAFRVPPSTDRTRRRLKRHRHRLVRRAYQIYMSYT